MDYLDDVVKAIKPILKNMGFIKKSLNWIKEYEEIIKIFNIQKSQYGHQVYINIGIIIKKFKNDTIIAHYKCDIRERLDDLIGKQNLDFENTISSNDRCEAFKILIESNPYNFFLFNGSKDDIKQFIKNLNNDCITKSAQDYIAE